MPTNISNRLKGIKMPGSKADKSIKPKTKMIKPAALAQAGKHHAGVLPAVAAISFMIMPRIFKISFLLR
jgi:hypothetical protein